VDGAPGGQAAPGGTGHGDSTPLGVAAGFRLRKNRLAAGRKASPSVGRE
jgi:hypothetical protein